MAIKWIQRMHMKRGSLTASAKKVGMSPMHFAEEKKNASGKTGMRARLALTLRKLQK